MVFEKQLPCGLRLVGETTNRIHSVSLGVWVRSGSALETAEENGLAHFIEHMVFKGTERRSASDIAEEMDSIGGNINAFTSKEGTCFYAKVVDEDLPEAVDVLMDMVLHAKLDPNDLELERTVILEELSMLEDVPEDYCMDLLSRAHFGDHVLGRQIIGTETNLRRFTRDDLLHYMSKYYRPGDMVVSAVGNFDPEELAHLINHYLEDVSADEPATVVDMPFKVTSPQTLIQNRETEQVHMALAFEGIPHTDQATYAQLVLNNMIGGGMSSRLFQKIREERGLAYSVYSFPSTYKQCGVFGIYTGTGKDKVMQVLDILHEELMAFRNGDFTFEQLRRARNQLKGNYILGLESTSSRMNSLGRGRLIYERILPVQEVLDGIKAVTREDVIAIAQRVLNPATCSVAMVGPVQNEDQVRNRIDQLRQG